MKPISRYSGYSINRTNIPLEPFTTPGHEVRMRKVGINLNPQGKRNKKRIYLI